MRLLERSEAAAEPSHTGARPEPGVRDLVRPAPPAPAGPIDAEALRELSPPPQVPTLAAESSVRPVLGPSSVLTANEPRHLPRRKLLLPAFHGEGIAAYERMIADAAEREISRWPLDRPFALAPRMQAITLDVIMGCIFGIDQRPRPGTPEHALRLAIREMLWSSTLQIARLAELGNLGRSEPRGLTRLGLLVPDRCVHAVIAKRRRAADLAERRDILSLLLRSEDEEGRPLSNRELRDELMTLVLAGHETTANQLAWAWERLLRAPGAHARAAAGGARGRRGRGGGPGRGDDPGGDAGAAGGTDDRPPGCGAPAGDGAASRPRGRPARARAAPAAQRDDDPGPRGAGRAEAAPRMKALNTTRGGRSR